MGYKEGDFLEVEYKIFHNGEPVGESFKGFVVIGKGMLLKGLEDEIKGGKTEGKVELPPEKAFGSRNKELIVVYRRDLFRKNNINPVVGGVYNMDGSLGVVRSVTGGRVVVDFNHPLAGKSVKVEYKVLRSVDDTLEKVNLFFSEILKMPKDKYKVENGKLLVDEELFKEKDVLEKAIKEAVPEANIVIEKFKNKGKVKKGSKNGQSN